LDALAYQVENELLQLIARYKESQLGSAGKEFVGVKEPDVLYEELN